MLLVAGTPGLMIAVAVAVPMMTPIHSGEVALAQRNSFHRTILDNRGLSYDTWSFPTWTAQEFEREQYAQIGR
jgi:hypothetical protein